MTVLENQDWCTLIEKREIWFRVTGDSMWPTLKLGDSVLIEPITGDPVPGSVVVVRDRKQLIVHRYTAPNITCGDNRLVPDPPFTDDALIGMVRQFRRNGRLRQLANRTPWYVQFRKFWLRLKRLAQ